LGDSASQLTDWIGDQEPKWSPDATKIVFQSGRAKGWEIFTVRTNGEDVYQVTNFSDCVNPDWSPSGDTIVYRHLDNGNYDLYSIPSVGGIPIRLTTDPGEESYPEYFPDGTKILFQYLPGVEGRRDIYMMPASGGSYTALTNNPAEDHISPSCSPDGRWIAFTSDRAGNNDIWVMDSRGEDYGLYQITADIADDQWPSWSPDGSRIIFHSDRSGNRDLWIASCLPITCGDANHDCVVNLSDAIFILNYLFKGGTPPDPLIIGDVNCSDAVDIGDAIYMLNYLFKGGSPPCQPSTFLSLGRLASVQTADIWFGLVESCEAQNPAEENTEIQILASCEHDIGGVQLELSYNPQEITSITPTLTERTKDLDIFFSSSNGILKIGILDLTGEHQVSAGDGPLVRLHVNGSSSASLEIQQAILVDEKATPFEVTILQREEMENLRPVDFALFQNHPNPFNPETEIKYTLPAAAEVKLQVYNVKGQKVRMLVDEYQTTGHHAVRWDGKDENGKSVASGVYFYRIQAGEFEDAKKMILMK
jgi:hypothetical protein